MSPAEILLLIAVCFLVAGWIALHNGDYQTAAYIHSVAMVFSFSALIVQIRRMRRMRK
jgi:uncharacterized membrane protein YccC